MPANARAGSMKQQSDFHNQKNTMVNNAYNESGNAAPGAL